MRRIIFILEIFSFFTLAGQHKASYIQYMFNGMLFNPAYAGSQGALNLTGLYRNQWLGIDGAPVSKSFTAHSPLKNKKVNLGLIVENETFAIYQQTNMQLAYAYRVKFLAGRLAMGLQAGAELAGINWSKLRLKDVTDPNFVSTSPGSNHFTGGAGLYYDDKNCYFGISAPQLYRNRFNDEGTYLFTGGLLLKPGALLVLKPAFLVKQANASPTLWNASATVYYSEILGLGAGLTMNTSWMVFTDLRINDQLHFGYGFERSVNQLKNYNAGSHELMLRYLFSYKLKVYNARYF